jgi:hypothetical protein
MNIIFLDFDGVIRVAIDGEWLSVDQAEFCQSRMQMLAGICLTTNSKIVVSSDWRSPDNLEQIKSYLSPHLADYLHQDWMTPICGDRWKEVERWLNHHPEVNHYAILEDQAIHFHNCPPQMAANLILCSNRHGLVPHLLTRIIELLNP